MSVECFLDANVLVYAAAGHGAEESKRQQALDLLEREDFGLSAQILQEFYVIVTRKLEISLSADGALEWIEQFESFPCLPVDASLVKLGAELSVRFKISYWDGAIIASAEALGAETLYTEDLNDGQLYGSVRVENPFKTL